MRPNLFVCLALLLPACLIWHEDGRGGPPGERHHSDDAGRDSADTGAPEDTDDPTDSAADPADTGAPDAGDSGTDDGRDSADTAVDTADTAAPAWTLSPECEGAPLTFLGARVDAETVAPGSRVVLAVTLHNPTSDDDLAYPGVHFSSSSPDIADPFSNWFYGLFAGTSGELQAVYEIPATFSGPVVLTATTTRLDCATSGDCPPACTISHPITVAP
jgi:hypothetical protein